ncbi:hypothetical protein [Trueperella pyogenes]
MKSAALIAILALFGQECARKVAVLLIGILELVGDQSKSREKEGN